MMRHFTATPAPRAHWAPPFLVSWPESLLGCLLGCLCLVLAVFQPQAGASEPAAAPSEYHTLTFAASIAGAAAGTATIAIARTEQHYRIAGRAQATGLMDAVSPWNASFWATGAIVEGEPVPTSYRYIERGRDKRREVTVRDGTLAVKKNGKQRPQRPALPGLDVLAALFMAGDCRPQVELHTGRHSYQLGAAPTAQTLSAGISVAAIPPRTCSYQVTDEDADTFDAQLQFTSLQNLRVPKEIRVSGALGGAMVLTDSKSRPLQCGAPATPLIQHLCSPLP